MTDGLEAEQAFRLAAAEIQIDLPDNIIGDGKLHRCEVEGERGKKNGAYVFHPDRVASGWFQNWKRGDGQNWCSRDPSTLSPVEKAAHRSRVAAAQEAHAADQERKHAEAREEAEQIWTESQPCESHPYLAGKRVQAQGVRVDSDGRLVVPVRDAGGVLHGVQHISVDGQKRFLTGSRVGGCHFEIGGSPDVACITEGFATGATISEATGYRVLLAFNCGNLLAIAREVRSRTPTAKIIVCADDDYLTDGNPGLTHATHAAQAVDGFLAVPVWVAERPEGATDFNDLARDEGIDAVRRCIEAAQVTSSAPSPAKYPHTESGWAALFADMFRHEARFVKDLRQWRWFDGKRWVVDEGNVLTLGKSGEITRALAARAYHKLTPDHEYEELLKAAQKTQRRQCRENIIALAKAEPGIAISSTEFDGDAMLLNCQNGTIDLRTGDLRPSVPGDLMTKILPVNYDASATCSRWDAFLPETLQDRETISFVQRFVGYCLTGDDSEHVIVFCYGAGANGKTVLVETIQALLGDYAVTAPTSLLMAKQNDPHPCDRMPLKGARMAAFSEVPSGQRFDEATVKSLTGGDTITGRGMHENFSTFKPTHKIWICGNHKPIVRGQDEGIWRRLRLIPFERVIPENQRDRKLKERLRGELPGILAWAVRGCLDWQRDGLGVSAKVKEATAGYREESDRLGPFLAERCTLDSAARVSRKNLYGTYESWCGREGERPMSTREFAEQIRRRGATEGNVREAGESVRGWHGIGVVDRGHVDTCGQQFPIDELREPHEGINSELVSTHDHVTTPSGDGQPEYDWRGRPVDLRAVRKPGGDS